MEDFFKACKNRDVKEICRILKDNETKIQKFFDACKTRDERTIRKSLRHTQDDQLRDLCDACRLGDVKTVHEVLSETSGSILDRDWNQTLIRLASEKGHAEIVRILLSYSSVDPSYNDNYALRIASKNGHVETVAVLLADKRACSKNTWCNIALFNASEYGHTKVVRLLLADPRVDASKVESTNPEITELLAQWKYYPR